MNQLDIFNKVIVNGSITLTKAFGYNYPIVTIKAVSFVEDFEQEELEEEEYVRRWNAYVERIRIAIGVESYCEWVYDNANMVGILAFYDKLGVEIKTKHFRDWKKLLDRIEGKVAIKSMYLYGESKISSISDISVKNGHEYIIVKHGKNKEEFLNREIDTDVWYDSVGNEAHIRTKKNKARKQISKYD